MKRAKDVADGKRAEELSASLLSGHTRQALKVCDLLQELADELPRQAVPAWRNAQIKCETTLAPYFFALNDVVLPKLLLQNSDVADRRDVLARLKSDCSAQIHALSDLDDLISDALTAGKYSDQPEVLGYALRGHFESLRRDLHWQMEVLWPLAARTLSKQEAELVLAAFRDTKAPTR